MKKILQRFLQICLVAFLCVPGNVLYASDFDDRIESSAKESYVFKHYLKDENIHIQSKDGAVILTGTVSEEFQKSLANDMAANLPGVKSVNNKLGLTSETPAVYSDAWILTKVKATLSFHRNMDGMGIEVWVGDGTVTLRGKASSTAQKDLAKEYAMDVEGVKNVINEITLAPAAMKPAEMKPDQSKVAKKIDSVMEFLDDASITALAKTTLMYHRSTSALNTIVTTNDGVVKLQGNVKNAAEKELATKLVSDVHGVKGVVNTMTLN
ncbi:MAG: BON domain-containing protein [Proteobacteria bacterium]|nr:BON domain-containing protein [Pseudomonadota bacterium]